MLKKLFKKVLPIFLSVIFGTICGKLVFSNYEDKITNTLNKEKVYLLQIGAYSNYDNMVNNTLVNNYIYYQDEDGLYKSVIGITQKEENIEKIKSLYQNEIITTEYYSNDKKLIKKLKEYDKILNKTTDNNEIKQIVKQSLELYKDNNSTLTKIVS